MAASDEKNFTSAMAASGSLALPGIIAEYTIIFCNSTGIGPTMSTPATAAMLDRCWFFRIPALDAWAR